VRLALALGQHGRNTTTNLEYSECQIEAQEFVYFSIRGTISLFVVVLADFPRELSFTRPMAHLALGWVAQG
jgi:hypothetical protein